MSSSCAEGAGVTAEKFMESPWKTEHPLFKEALFGMRPSPEFSTGEIILSSLYRASGFQEVSESKVKGNGDAFRKAANKSRSRDADTSQIQPETWRTVLDRIVQSPK